MCGVVMAVGKVDLRLFDLLLYESEVRGVHSVQQVHMGNCCIGHARYSTSGNVAQPLTIGKRTIAFNGVVSMSSKKEMEKLFKIKMLTDNDGEVLLKSYETYFDLIAFISRPTISFAGVILEGKKLISVRNERRPLWKAKHKGCEYVASTKDIFLRAGIKKCEELKPLKIYSWTI